MSERVLLIGAGHSNLQVLHALGKVSGKKPVVTLLSDVLYAPYSGMIPSFFAGQYRRDELQFDLQALCRRFAFKFVFESVMQIASHERFVITSSGQRIDYDICSMDIGSQPSRLRELRSNSIHLIYLKPISQLLEKWHVLTSTHAAKPLDMTVVGGGAAAFEIAVACRLAFPTRSTMIRLLSGTSMLLAAENSKAHSLARMRLKQLGIELIEGQRVESVADGVLVLSNETTITTQLCLIATSAEAPALLRESNLPTSVDGFVRVTETLNVEGFETLFASGDCSYFTAQPLAKSGVFAVRQGPILCQNILASLSGTTAKHVYKPQSTWLKLLVSGDRRAIAIYGGLAFEGRLAWRIKDFIDRRFMRRFR